MCNYCVRAFYNHHKEDPPYGYFKYLIDKEKQLLGVTDVLFEVEVDDYGKLKLGLMGDEYATIATKKIKYCPMCGCEIPEITPSRQHELDGKEE